MPDFTSTSVWLSLLTLTFLEIVLGVDNIIFISITSSKLPKEQQKSDQYRFVIGNGIKNYPVAGHISPYCYERTMD